MTTKISSNTHSNLRNRLSQWIIKALPALPIADRSSTSLSMYRISGPTELNSVQSSPNCRVHTKQSSISSYWTLGGGRGTSFDIEKTPLPPQAATVGIALLSDSPKDRGGFLFRPRCSGDPSTAVPNSCHTRWLLDTLSEAYPRLNQTLYLLFTEVGAKSPEQAT